MDVNVVQPGNSRISRERRKIQYNSIMLLILFVIPIPLAFIIVDPAYILVGLYWAIYSIPYVLIGIYGLAVSKTDKSSLLSAYSVLLVIFIGYCIFNLVFDILLFISFFFLIGFAGVSIFFCIMVVYYIYSILYARKSVFDSRRLKESLDIGFPIQDPIIVGDYSMQQQYVQAQPNYGQGYQQPYPGYWNQQYNSGYNNPQFNQGYGNPQYNPGANNPAYRNPGNAPGFVNPAPISSGLNYTGNNPNNSPGSNFTGNNSANNPEVSSTGNNPANSPGLASSGSNPSNI
ncbi:unnamed protein product [Blepharisma stoltei]|uniref:Uncharacterized protein n=1 Tax=Blepharisma stoltei TaxID=1481888 RepID=A0AAU9J6B7_9CILI|nr:unnamed protein product [Blepharisma stoltei]